MLEPIDSWFNQAGSPETSATRGFGWVFISQNPSFLLAQRNLNDI
jgi:hypothetical protein